MYINNQIAVRPLDAWEKTMRRKGTHMKKRNLIALNLRHFDGAGSGAGAGAGGEGAGAGTGEAGTPSAAGKIDVKEIAYGKQAEPAGDIQPAEPAEPEAAVKAEEVPDRKAEFEKLIKSDYKDLFSERVQQIIDNRFKQTKELEGKVNTLNPVMEMLARKYGVDGNDAEALAQAIESDNSYYEDEAVEKGMTVEQLKEFKRMEKENFAYKKAMEEREQRENGERLYQTWITQAEQLKEKFPAFDLDVECENADFVDLLSKGIDVETAHLVIHKDDVLGGAMQYTAQKVQEKVINNIKARGSRPTENGISSQSATVRKTNVNDLDSNDIQEVLRRVQKGEKISF